MKFLNLFKGIMSEFVATAIALISAYVISWYFDESVHFRGGLISLLINCCIIISWYFIWYLVKEKQTRDMDFRHYRRWSFHIITSMAIGIIIGNVYSINSFGILDYSAWIYFIIIVVGILLQLGGAAISYAWFRPR